jgi:very-short-patch-repair endonuclease
MMTPKINPKKTKKQHQYLRNNMTKWEVRLWNDLKGRKMYGFKVRRQYGIENYIVDFYYPALKLAIEINGDVHFFDEKVKKDKEKNDCLKAEGIKVIRIENLDFEEDYESVLLHLEDLFRDRAKEFNIELNENF